MAPGFKRLPNTIYRLCFKALLVCTLLFNTESAFAKSDFISFSSYVEAIQKTNNKTEFTIPEYSIVILSEKPSISFSVKPRTISPGTISINFNSSSPQPTRVETAGNSLSERPLESQANPEADNIVPTLADLAPYKGIIAIIIDDIGNNRIHDTRAANLPGDITLAVLPFTPHSKNTAVLGKQNNKEIMLHAPMENDLNRALGDGALTLDLEAENFKQVLQDSIEAIPHVQGVNNHMGSLLTENQQAMNWVMETVSANNLYFVDSRTSADSVAEKTAAAFNIQSTSRNVFLDNERSEDYIGSAFDKTLAISEKFGFALAIGHPYPETLDYLERRLPELEKEGFMLLKVSHFMDLKKQASMKRINQKSIAKN